MAADTCPSAGCLRRSAGSRRNLSLLLATSSPRCCCVLSWLSLPPSRAPPAAFQCRCGPSPGDFLSLWQASSASVGLLRGPVHFRVQSAWRQSHCAAFPLRLLSVLPRLL